MHNDKNGSNQIMDCCKSFKRKKDGDKYTYVEVGRVIKGSWKSANKVAQAKPTHLTMLQQIVFDS